jgi:hypothetical protein
VVAGGAIHLDEFARSEILDPCRKLRAGAVPA